MLHNVEWVLGDAEVIDFPERSFDVVTCSSAMLYLEDIPTAISRMRRWLRPGGRLVFNTPQVCELMGLGPSSLQLMVCAWSYLVYRIGNWIPIWQPSIEFSFQQVSCRWLEAQWDAFGHISYTE
jgi:SAM-dependent methyltransferase